MVEKAMDTREEKIKKLKNILEGYQKVAVAFSGGVDSSLLSKVSYDVLKDSSVAVTAMSPFFSEEDIKRAESIGKQIGIRHKTISINPLKHNHVRENRKDRCYHCKNMLLAEIRKVISEDAVIIDGTNIDDFQDFRPGQKALDEHGIKSPLAEAGMTKADIRFFARQFSLPNWDTPSASCLATRIPYDDPLDEDKIKKAETAENILKDLGLPFSRARIMNQELLRIEAEEKDIKILFDQKKSFIDKMKKLGFKFITVDLEGYRPSGSKEGDELGG